MTPFLFLAGVVLLPAAQVGVLIVLWTYAWEPVAFTLSVVSFLGLALGLAFFPDAFERYVSGPAERRDLRWLQSKRDRWVRKHAAGLLDGKMSFCLYLRPFVSSGAVRVVTSGYEIGLSDRKGRFRPQGLRTDRSIQREDLEAILAEAVLSTSPLVALGRPGEQFGAARWKTEDGDWQDLVRELFGRAELVFVIPSAHDGTLWELRQLLSMDNWRAKTVIVIPSAGESFGYDAELADKTLRNGAASNPMIEVSRLREEALETLAVEGGHAAAHRAAAYEHESFLMLSRNMQVSLIRPLERRTGQQQRERSPGQDSRNANGLMADYLPSHSSFVTLERDHVRDVVDDLRAHARRALSDVGP